MTGYIAAAYIVTFGGLSLYAVRVVSQVRALRRQLNDGEK